MILTYMVGFNLVASFNVADSFKVYSFYNPSLTPILIGIIQAVIFGICISGGGKQIAKITGILVPVMGGLYIAAALLMIILHGNMIPGMFASIFEGAFDIQAIFGGFMRQVSVLPLPQPVPRVSATRSNRVLFRYYPYLSILLSSALQPHFYCSAPALHRVQTWLAWHMCRQL